VIRHAALFRLKAGYCWESPEVRAAERLQEELGRRIPEVRDWQCGRNVSTRDIAYDYAIFGLFADEASLQRYLAHPFHRTVAEAWRRISDYVIADVRV
jgi:hypothetical protein